MLKQPMSLLDLHSFRYPMVKDVDEKMLKLWGREFSSRIFFLRPAQK